jgi:ferredoxin
MPYIITEPCVGVKDKACVDVCPVDCIYEFDGEAQLYINPTECIECGACESACPVSAIFMDSEVPENQKQYIDINAAKFN